MPVNFNNTTCVTGAEIIKMGIPKNTLCSWAQRGKFKVVRKAGGYNSPMLIAVDSLPQELKVKVVEKFGEPETVAQVQEFKDSIGVDQDAIEFYRTHKINGKHIHIDNQYKYINNASILNALHITLTEAEETRRPLGANMKGFWPNASKKINQLKGKVKEDDIPIVHNLPSNYRELKAKYEKYIATIPLTGKPDYAALINGRYGIANAEKLCAEAKDWLVAKYSLPIKILVPHLWAEYNAIAESMGWEQLKSDVTIANFLNQPEITKLWHAPRHGKEAAANALNVINKTRLPDKRDVLWYSDGTKMNLYFKKPGATAKKDYTSKATAYVIIDVYSECILGWNIAATEDHYSQVTAMRMAMAYSGQKPQEWRVDNQGGHGKIADSNVFSNVAKLVFNTQPYNGKSKTIESVFGRFQIQVQRMRWYYTGQNITAKKLNSRQNMDFILANLDKLPTLEKAIADFAEDVATWNSMPHPKHGSTRAQLYAESKNPNTQPFELWDAVQAFWIQHSQQVTYTNYGLSFKLNNVKYHYAVYNNDQPDWNFYDAYLNEKFVVKYDVDDMSQVALYTKDGDKLRFVAMAETKREVGRATADITPEENRLLRATIQGNKDRAVANQERMAAIWDKTGISPQGLIQPPTSIGEYTKALSNADTEDEDTQELVPVPVNRKPSIYDEY